MQKRTLILKWQVTHNCNVLHSSTVIRRSERATTSGYKAVVYRNWNPPPLPLPSFMRLMHGSRCGLYQDSISIHTTLKISKLLPESYQSLQYRKAAWRLDQLKDLHVESAYPTSWDWRGYLQKWMQTYYTSSLQECEAGWRMFGNRMGHPLTLRNRLWFSYHPQASCHTQ